MAMKSNTAAEITEQKDESDIVLSARDITVSFADKLILDKLSLDIRRGEILGFVGASGAGKSVLLRTILGLTRKQSGTIKLFGVDVEKASDKDRLRIDMRLGVLFQHGALFSALTVLENVQVPMREYLDLPRKLMDELAMLKVELVGLPPDAARKFPSELSGGMIKRAALARALALDPDIVFLDEPTSGLDPISAAEFDELVVKLRDTMDLTVYMVTHDLDTLFTACDRVAVLDAGHLVETGPVTEVFLHPQHPTTRRFVNESEQVDEGELHKDFQAVAGRIVRLTFLGADTYEPLLGRIARDTGVDYNILSGRIDRIKDTPYGQLTVSLVGGDVQAAQAGFVAAGVHLEELRR